VHHIDESLKVLPLNTTANKTENLSSEPEKVNNDADKKPLPTKDHEVVVDDDEMAVIQAKEGRAINFPMEILGNHRNSTMEHMLSPINFVTTSTDKPHVMSFFDLSDVSMDHDDDVAAAAAAKQNTKASTEKPGVEVIMECTINGTYYKASSKACCSRNNR